MRLHLIFSVLRRLVGFETDRESRRLGGGRDKCSPPISDNGNIAHFPTASRESGELRRCVRISAPIPFQRTPLGVFEK